jgi:hypothetical protein
MEQAKANLEYPPHRPAINRPGYVYKAHPGWNVYALFNMDAILDKRSQFLASMYLMRP